MSSDKEDSEPSSPPVIVGRKILDSPTEITKKDYERMLKVTTRKRSLSTSPVKEKPLNEIKSEEPGPTKAKKRKITHEQSSEEPEKMYHCRHNYCNWSTADKQKLLEHLRDEEFHKDHLKEYQLFCVTCQNEVREGGWTDFHNQKIVEAARQRKNDMVQLIEKLKDLNERKMAFKKSEEEFIYRDDINYRPDASPTPGSYNPKFGNTPAKIELPDGVQEFEFLPEEWEKQNYFGNIFSNEFNDTIPVNAKRIIAKYKNKELSVEKLLQILEQMLDRYKKIEHDEVYQQWLLYNICQLKLFILKNGLKATKTQSQPNIVPINSAPVTPQIVHPIAQNVTPVALDLSSILNSPEMKVALAQALAQEIMKGAAASQIQQQLLSPQQFGSPLPIVNNMAAYYPAMQVQSIPVMQQPQPMQQLLQQMLIPQQIQLMSSQSSVLSSSSPPSYSSHKKDKRKKHKT